MLQKKYGKWRSTFTDLTRHMRHKQIQKQAIMLHVCYQNDSCVSQFAHVLFLHSFFFKSCVIILVKKFSVFARVLSICVCI